MTFRQKHTCEIWRQRRDADTAEPHLQVHEAPACSAPLPLACNSIQHLHCQVFFSRILFYNHGKADSWAKPFLLTWDVGSYLAPESVGRHDYKQTDQPRKNIWQSFTFLSFINNNPRKTQKFSSHFWDRKGSGKQCALYSLYTLENVDNNEWEKKKHEPSVLTGEGSYAWNGAWSERFH